MMTATICAVVLAAVFNGQTLPKIVAVDQKDRAVVMMSADADASVGFCWKWRPDDDPNIREKDIRNFNNVSDCKVRDGGRTILVCASHGGFAAIDVAARRIRWQGCASHRGGGPHAIERLPDGRVAIANSTGVDALEIIDVSTAPFEPEKQKLVRAWNIPGAHGVAWDAARNSLFVIGHTNIIEFAYASESMSVKPLRTWDFAKVCGDEYGHDFMPDGKGGYWFTCNSGVWHFDPRIGTQTNASSAAPLGDDTSGVVRVGAFERLHSDRYVKGFDRTSDSVDLMTIPREKWWTDRLLIRSKDGERVIGPFPGSRFYKAHWFCNFSCWFSFCRSYSQTPTISGPLASCRPFPVLSA